jgi:hypothetical protein
MHGLRSLVVLAVLSAPAAAAAADIPVGGDATVEVHGFVSPGFIVTTDNNYLAKSKRGSFEFNEVGINFTAPLTDKLRAGVQLFARDLGRIGNYTPKADWFYLDYKVEDYFGLRAGRVKIPFGLYNDTSDIDVARVPVLLPQSIYSATSRDFLLAQTGAEIYGRIGMRALGAFEYRIYTGTIFLDAGEQTSLTTQVTDLDVPYVAGQRLMWETPLEGLRVGGSLESLRLDATFSLPAQPGQPPKPIGIGVPVTLWLASAEYVSENLLLAAEYSRWVVRLETTEPTVYPSAQSVSERGYAMASYRVAPWLWPGAYYSLLFPDIHNREGRANVQHDIAGTLRFDVNRHWLVKLEGHFMSGTAGLTADLNDGKQPSQLAKNWGAFLVKTTAYF